MYNFGIIYTRVESIVSNACKVDAFQNSKRVRNKISFSDILMPRFFFHLCVEVAFVLIFSIKYYLTLILFQFR